MYEIYLNSFDYLLNLYNNEISDGDTYFKNVAKSKPCTSRQDSIIHDENYNDLYLEENNSMWVCKIFKFLKLILIKVLVVNPSKKFSYIFNIRNNIAPM